MLPSEVVLPHPCTSKPKIICMRALPHARPETLDFIDEIVRPSRFWLAATLHAPEPLPDPKTTLTIAEQLSLSRPLTEARANQGLSPLRARTPVPHLKPSAFHAP